MCWFMDAAAPMTKTVEDCAVMLGVIAGYDEKDPYTSHKLVPDYTAKMRDGVKGLRVGLIKELHYTPDMHPDVRSPIEASLDTFRELGAEVTEVSIPLAELAGAIFVGVADTEGAGARDEILRNQPGDLDQASRTRLQSAALVPAKVYNRAAKARVLLRRSWLATHLHSSQPFWNDPHVLVHGRRRPHDQDCRRLRGHAGSHSWLRRKRPVPQPQTGPGLHG